MIERLHTEPVAGLSRLTRIAHPQLVVAWITLFIVGTDLFVVSPLIPLIADMVRSDAAHTGLLVTVFACAYALAAPVFGHVADRLGRRKVLLCCLGAFAAANLATAMAANLPQLLAIRLVCGIAAAGVTPSIYSLLGDAAPPGHRGRWIAVGVTGLLSALPLGATAGAWASARLGWESVFLAIGCAALMLLALNAVAWPRAMGASRSEMAAAETFALLPLMRALLPTVAWSAGLYGMYTYLGAGLTAAGYTTQQITATMFLYGSAAFTGALIGGRIADRLGPPVAIRIGLSALAIAFVALEIALRLHLLVVGALGLTSIVAQVFFPAQQASLIATFHDRRSAALSWNNSALFLGMTLGSFLGSQVMARAGFSAIPAMSALLACFALLICPSLSGKPLVSAAPDMQRMPLGRG